MSKLVSMQETIMKARLELDSVTTANEKGISRFHC